jgi:hypothetical protein
MEESAQIDELTAFGKEFAAARKAGQSQFMSKVTGKMTTTDVKDSSGAPKPAASPTPTTSWANPATKDYSTSNKGVDKPSASPSLPTMATATPKTGAGAGVAPLPGATQSASITNPKPAMDPGSLENAKRKTGSLNEGVQVGTNKYRIV